MQEKIFNRLLDERMGEIREISKKVKYNDLTYHYITPGIKPTRFIEFRGPLPLFKEIGNGDKSIKEVQKEQIKLKSKTGEITSRNPRHKVENRKDTIENVQNLYDLRQKVIDLFNDYSRIRSDTIRETKQSKTNKETSGVGLKILIPKQMLQRLPIALAQVKAGNN